ncbi:MAG: type II toxin-antitoxin system VapC family toxin [candidate division NC10 bacterium]
MNVVDASAWLEYFANGPGAGFFAPAIEDSGRLVVPTICLLEVFKRVLQQKGEGAALQAVATMQQGQVHPMDSSIAIRAARLGVAHKLPLADSVVLAVARHCAALLWTQDADFEGLDNVRYLPKGRAR